MSNPFEEINQKLDRVLEAVGKGPSQAPILIPFSEFCKDRGISRQTGYAWDDRGLIKLEKVGGRQFVLADSVSVRRKETAHLHG
jgi:hypothetical protein